MSWHDTGMDVAARGHVMRFRFFRGFGIREFEMRELLASWISDIPMCDELLLLGASPYRLNIVHMTCPCVTAVKLSIGFSAFLTTRCLCPWVLRFPETRWPMAVDLSAVHSSLQSLPPVIHLLLRSHTLIRRLPRYRFSRSRNSACKSLQL
jgi:hypothetical protein